MFLGVLQGITEFLPVSSSGHLTLFEYFLGASDTPLVYDVLLHLASLLAVLYFFRIKILSLIRSLYTKEMKEERREILFILVSTFITVTMLPLTKPVVYLLKSEPSYLLFTFMFTALILFIADYFLKKGTGRNKLCLKDAFITGIFQGFAVFPGISRSGSTICGGLISGIKGEKAVEYSFLLAIPAIAGASLLEIGKGTLSSIDFSIVSVGFICSFFSSLLSLKLLVFLIKKTQLKPFAYYLIAVSFLVFNIFWI